MQTNLRVMLLVAILTLFPGIAMLTAAHPGKQGASTSSASQQDKVKACNDMADKKGLKGDDRKNFLQTCISKTTDTTPVSEKSQKEKMDACKDLADKKNLKGEDRRTFLKDCMNKANSK